MGWGERTASTVFGHPAGTYANDTLERCSRERGDLHDGDKPASL